MEQPLTHAAQPSPPPASPPQQASNGENLLLTAGSPSTPSETGEAQWTKWLAISTAILAFFTSVVAVGSIHQSFLFSNQLGEMHKTSDTDRRMLELSQRAYIFFYETNLQPSHGSYIVTKVIENSGNTATKHLRYSMKCTTVDSNLPVSDPFDLFKWDSSTMSRDIVGARQKKSIVPNDSNTCNLTSDTIDKIASGASRRYEAGEVIYYEAFHPTCRRITQFAEEIVISNGITSALPRGEHNCTDDDCPGEHRCQSE
jgi:hypothetical protein